MVLSGFSTFICGGEGKKVSATKEVPLKTGKKAKKWRKILRVLYRHGFARREKTLGIVYKYLKKNHVIDFGTDFTFPSQPIIFFSFLHFSITPSHWGIKKSQNSPYIPFLFSIHRHRNKLKEQLKLKERPGTIARMMTSHTPSGHLSNGTA